MAEKIPQTYANHTKYDPQFHFFLAPVAVIGLVASIWRLIQHFGWESGIHLLVVIWLVIAVFRIRIYSLRVQDRVIRLEERLRLASLLAEPLKSRIGELTERQLIALRFASDAEAPALVEKALSGKLSSAEIKKAIVSWRADYFRV